MKSLHRLFILFIFVIGYQSMVGKDNNQFPIVNKDSAKHRTIAYTIKIPGKDLGDGSFSPAKIHKVMRGAPEDILPNRIRFKTKTYSKKSKENTCSDVLSKTVFKDLVVKSIKTPFADYSRGDLLSRDEFGLSRIYELSFEGNSDVYNVCREMMKNPEIEYAEPVYIDKILTYTPNDTSNYKQHYLDLIQAYDAWDVTQGDTNVVIAIVDNAIQWNHVDLLDNIWYNRKEIPDNEIDDDGNGKIDDYHGWDLVGNFSYDNYNFEEDNDPAPLSSSVDHGTHVAGCASAATNNITGISGVGFKCKILPVKAGSDNPQFTSIISGYEGIEYASRMGADIINCSWGNVSESLASGDVISEATSRGSLVVASGGNDATDNDVEPHYPTNYDGVLSVGATNKVDAPANFSDWGVGMTVFAPGTEILSTVPYNSYASFQGTSMASPITAGLAGLVKSVFPHYTPKQIIHQIRSTCDNVLASGTNRPKYYGRINAFKAVTYNNSKFPDKKVPGCEVEQLSFNVFDGIENFNPLTTKLKITNYLAATKDLKIKLMPLDDFIEVSDTEYSVGEINTLGSKDITVNVRLKENCPWLQGYVRIIVEFNDGDYQDYSIVNLPIFLENANAKWSSASNFNASYETQAAYINGYSDQKDIAYFCGESYWNYNTGVLLTAESSINDIENSQSDCNQPISASCVFDNRIFVSGYDWDAETASISVSTNQGSTWNNSINTDFTKFINDFKIFSTSKAVVLGDPKNGKWGVGVASTSQYNFTQVTNIPNPEINETSSPGASCFKDSCVWFGTKIGRVFYSSDYGNSWTATEPTGMKIISLAFSDKNNGVVLGIIPNKNYPVYLSNTTDGGATWHSEIYTYSYNYKYPIKVYSHPSGNFILQFYDGRISVSNDIGVNWLPIPAMEATGTQAGTAFCDDSSAQVWNIGDELSNITFNMPNIKWNKKILVNEGQKINCDTVLVGKSDKTPVNIKNIGDAKVLLSNYSIEPGENSTAAEFKVLIGYSKVIDKSDTGSFSIRFSPKTTGPKSATLIITNTSDSSAIRVPISGYANESAGTIEEAVVAGISAYPNPANTQCRLDFAGKITSSVQVTDNSGLVVFDTRINELSNSYLLNTANYSSGMYIVTMTCESGARYYLKLNVLR